MTAIWRLDPETCPSANGPIPAIPSRAGRRAVVTRWAPRGTDGAGFLWCSHASVLVSAPGWRRLRRGLGKWSAKERFSSRRSCFPQAINMSWPMETGAQLVSSPDKEIGLSRRPNLSNCIHSPPEWPNGCFWERRYECRM